MRSLLALFLLLTLPALAEESSLRIIAYHDIRDDVAGDYDPDQYAVSTRNLIMQFAWLREYGFQPVSVDDVIAAANNGPPLPERAVLLSFDDGLASVYTKVYPLLKLFQYPAVVSVVTGWIESDTKVSYGGRDRSSEDFLTWEQIVEMQASGLVEVASHSQDLHRGVRGNPQGNSIPAAVTRLYDGDSYETDLQYRQRIEADLSASVNIIRERTGRAPRVISWPYGAYNDDIAAVARDLGMRISLTLAPENSTRNGSIQFGRYLVESNPSLSIFSAELMLDQPPAIVRVAQVDLDYVYDPDPQQQEANLGRLLNRIKALEISHVFLQAFADPDGDGGADALYFPNRHLPVRADLFGRVAWQLRTRADVSVYAWLPMLSFVGGSFEAEWRAMEYRDGIVAPDPHSEPRLSPFNAEVTARIAEVYEDLATHSRFDGLLFHDDGRLNEFEDFSDAAIAVYRESFGPDISPEELLGDAALKDRWVQLKSRTLLNLGNTLADKVRHYQPGLKTARNLFASALLDEQSIHYLAQDFDQYLETYDHVALMAMPGLEAAEDERRFYEQLVAAVSKRVGGFERTIFELQTIDWRQSEPVDSERLRRTMRWLQSLGVRHLGYYPDDFIGNQPRLDDLRQGISLADGYGEVMP
ncbi:MAG: poly-beta-1,6-N-acetyl-D-glucosamine N-deacetylase PgaB [Gammaproteobacteria bacterium]|nr:poly-beta-1,6-N-acetyl-D-glucosamine N-deacetylase PgaB [Gammaproteobacteria bacterium]